MTTPRVEIRYCAPCKFLARATWLAQELLTTFEKELAEVALVPRSGGIFEIAIDGQIVFSNRQAGRFPEAREIKEIIRDRVAPGKVIGHG